MVGGSIGNLWALRLGQAQPARVERVVLMGGAPLFSEIDVPSIIKLLASPLGAVMARLPEKPARVLSIVRGNGHGASLDAGRMDEFIEWRVALGREADSMRHERDMVRSFVDWRHGSFRPGLLMKDEEIAGIDQPTLLVYGSEDPVGSVEKWERFVGLMPRGDLRIVDGGGHMPWLDDPVRVGRLIRDFVALGAPGYRYPSLVSTTPTSRFTFWEFSSRPLANENLLEDLRCTATLAAGREAGRSLEWEARRAGPARVRRMPPSGALSIEA